MYGGVSFYDYAQAMTPTNLTFIGGGGGGILAGSLDDLKTRQLSDCVRINAIYGGVGSRNGFNIDFRVANASVNEFGQSSDFSNKLHGVGMLGVLGFRFINLSYNGVARPTNPWPPGIVRGRLQGYSAFDNTGAAIYDTGFLPMGTFGTQNIPPSGYLGGANISGAYADWTQGTAGLITPLIDSDRVAGALNWYAGAPWEYGWITSAASGIGSFRLSVDWAAPNAGDSADIELGKIWIGNRLSPTHGIAAPTHGFVDQSQVVVSRDAQAYATYFTRTRTLGVTFPALYESEAIGVGYHPTGAKESVLSDAPVVTANNMQWAMDFLGVSRPCLLAAYGRPSVGDLASGQRAFRNALYGRPTQWQNLAPLLARKNPVARSLDTLPVKDHMYTCGVTVVEEG